MILWRKCLDEIGCSSGPNFDDFMAECNANTCSAAVCAGTATPPQATGASIEVYVYSSTDCTGTATSSVSIPNDFTKCVTATSGVGAASYTAQCFTDDVVRVCPSGCNGNSPECSTDLASTASMGEWSAWSIPGHCNSYGSGSVAYTCTFDNPSPSGAAGLVFSVSLFVTLLLASVLQSK